MRRGFVFYAFIFTTLAMLLSSGCRSSRPGKGASIGDEDISLDRPMADRFEAGERINIYFEPVMFNYDSFKIKPSEVARVDSVASYMAQNAETVCVLEGHCDERGSSQYNMSLGEQRAQSVRQQLIGVGIASDRLQTRSYGEERPADPGHSESAWSKNRRVEFKILSK